MFGLNTDLMMSILRHLLTFVGGIIVAKGWLSADMMAQLTGGIVSIAAVLFSAFFHAQSNGAIPPLSTTSNILNLTPVAPSAQVIPNAPVGASA